MIQSYIFNLETPSTSQIMAKMLFFSSEIPRTSVWIIALTLQSRLTYFDLTAVSMECAWFFIPFYYFIRANIWLNKLRGKQVHKKIKFNWIKFETKCNGAQNKNKNWKLGCEQGLKSILAKMRFLRSSLSCYFPKSAEHIQ